MSGSRETEGPPRVRIAPAAWTKPLLRPMPSASHAASRRASMRSCPAISRTGSGEVAERSAVRSAGDGRRGPQRGREDGAERGPAGRGSHQALFPTLHNASGRCASRRLAMADSTLLVSQMSFGSMGSEAVAMQLSTLARRAKCRTTLPCHRRSGMQGDGSCRPPDMESGRPEVRVLSGAIFTRNSADAGAWPCPADGDQPTFGSSAVRDRDVTEGLCPSETPGRTRTAGRIRRSGDPLCG
ncbi:hypothetical protein WYO_5008 [Methylobacterium sp. GXF4]|nr:hypothetical protein WYO_5008 [Methylobacterium sp. GXF4]